MLKTHLKIAWRGLWQQKGYAAVNLLSLATGLACCLCIFLFVRDEWRFDRFHRDHERIYRVTTLEREEGVSRHMANSYLPLADLLYNGFPEIEQIVQYFPYNVSISNPATNGRFQEADFAYADSLFFDLFDFTVLQGRRQTLLQRPDAVVLTESAARRYFGDANPLGQPLRLEGQVDLVVTGVVADPPANSSLQFSLLAAMSVAYQFLGDDMVANPHRAWFYPSVYTFIKLPASVTPDAIAARMETAKREHLLDYLVDRYDFRLQPLAEMHFTALESDLRPSVNPATLYVLLGIALLILTIACVNYINLTLSKLIGRFREIGMRRVLGANNGQLLQQMGMESALYLGLSLLLALGLLQLALPGINNLLGKQLHFWEIGRGWAGPALLGLVLGLGLIITAFPFLAALRYKVAGILKNEHLAIGKSPKLSLRTGFIVFQFATATALIIATLVIQQQLAYIRHKDLGMQTEQIMVVPIRDQAMQNDFSAAKQSLSTIPGVVNVSAISNFPWEKGFYDFNSTITGQGKNIKTNLPTLLVEEDFLETMNLRLQEGRGFSKAFGTDQGQAFLLNEAAARQYGIDSLEGLRLSMRGIGGGEAREGGIIGILENFHLKSLHHPIEPLVITTSPMTYFMDNFVLRLETADLSHTVAAIGRKLGTLAPDRPFEYFFLDDAFAQLYEQENQLAGLIRLFTMLALAIACLGMFALSAFAARRRIREISIRKVLGASVLGIVGLLSKDFLKLVFIALIIATPVAWYAMRTWLKDFAYRVELQWWVFALAGAAALLIALLTLGFQSVRAALANPVKSLRSE